MQYLLTEDELEALQMRPEMKTLIEQQVATTKLRRMLLKAKNYECIHERRPRADEYCDGCPVDWITNEEISTELSKLMCPLSRNYGK